MEETKNFESSKSEDEEDSPTPDIYSLLVGDLKMQYDKLPAYQFEPFKRVNGE